MVTGPDGFLSVKARTLMPFDHGMDSTSSALVICVLRFLKW